MAGGVVPLDARISVQIDVELELPDVVEALEVVLAGLVVSARVLATLVAVSWGSQHYIFQVWSLGRTEKYQNCLDTRIWL